MDRNKAKLRWCFFLFYNFTRLVVIIGLILIFGLRLILIFGLILIFIFGLILIFGLIFGLILGLTIWSKPRWHAILIIKLRLLQVKLSVYC
jgi:hypothetical protein